MFLNSDLTSLPPIAGASVLAPHIHSHCLFSCNINIFTPEMFKLVHLVITVTNIRKPVVGMRILSGKVAWERWKGRSTIWKGGFMSGLRHGPTPTVLTSSGWVLVPLSVCSFFRIPYTPSISILQYVMRRCISISMENNPQRYAHKHLITPEDSTAYVHDMWLTGPLKVHKSSFTRSLSPRTVHVDSVFRLIRFGPQRCTYRLPSSDTSKIYLPDSRYTATKAHRICL